jgi:short-subunit dehydrogenase
MILSRLHPRDFIDFVLKFKMEVCVETKVSAGKKDSSPLAVITGASSGIGFELAKVFAKHGFDLLVVAEDAGIHSAAGAFRALGVQVTPMQIDLAQNGGVDFLYQQITSLGQPVDTLVLNAGVGVGGEFVKTDLAAEMNLIQLNIISVVRLAKCVLRDMVVSQSGRMLFTSSVAAEMPGPYYAVYAASKAFVQSFAQAIRAELKDTGITVTSLQPGATDTAFFTRADMVHTKAGQSEKDDPAVVAQQGFDALMAGKDHVVAGSFMNAIQTTIGKFIPETLGATMQGKQTKPEAGTELSS